MGDLRDENAGDLRDEELRARLAEWVRPAASWPAPDVRTLQGRVRRRRVRAAASGVAGVTMAGVVALVLALVLGGAAPSVPSPSSSSSGWAPAGGLPTADAGPGVAPYVVTLGVQSSPVSAIVTNAFTGRVLARVRAPGGFAGVAAAGDDRTFVLASGSSLGFYELRLRADGRQESLTRVLGVPSGGSITPFAISPDARQLAYATAHGITVVSLATGRGRSWTSRVPGSAAALSFAGDGTLAFTWLGAASGIRLLDTSAPGTDLMASRVLVQVSTKPGGITGVGDVLISPDGSKVFATVVTAGPSAQVAEFSVRTGRAPAVVTPRADESGHGTSCLALWTDPSGRRLTAECGVTGTVSDGKFTAARLHVPLYNFSTFGNSFIAW